MKGLRLLFLIAALGLLYYGLRHESRAVLSLDGARTQEMNGPAFVQGATMDRFWRRGAALVDTHSSLGQGSEAAALKDCPT